MKKGFTLVELSIVLVVIGLLVGGILAGQSMIETARVNAFVKQMQHIDTLVSNHRYKYSTWPGDADLTKASFRIGAEKLDGKVCDDNCIQDGWLQQYEIGAFFLDLQILDGFLSENCLITYNASSRVNIDGPQCNTPLGQLGVKNAIIIGNASSGYAPHRNKNLYFFADCTGMTSFVFSSTPSGGCIFPFTGLQATAYDRKIDDGLSGSGNVLGRGAMFTGSMVPTALLASYQNTTTRDTILMQVITPTEQ